jgi:uncharacterized membrane protein YeaQ/YmgE (transglycosylase-associated protein family)
VNFFGLLGFMLAGPNSTKEYAIVDDSQIGWLGAILIGGIAGWLAEVITRSNMGILVNIVLGVIGAGLASWLAAKIGIQIGGPAWLNYLIFGFVGACILIFATKMFYPDRWRT